MTSKLLPFKAPTLETDRQRPRTPIRAKHAERSVRRSEKPQRPDRSPRLQVIVSKSLYTTIAKLARLQGRSLSAVTRDFLEEIEPVVARIAALLEAAKTTDAKGRQDMVETLTAVYTTLEGAEKAGSEALDSVAGRVGASRPKRTRPPNL
jgi:hypothetical protein